MKRRLLPLSLIALATGSTIGAVHLWNGTQTPTAAAAEVREPLLSAPKDRLNFGEVWEDERYGWIVPITNIYRETIHIEDISTSCTCVVAAPRSFTLAPGETREVRLTLNLLPKSGEATNAARTFSTNITFTTKSQVLAPARETLVLSGRVRPVLELRPREPSFGEAPELIQPPPPMTFAVAPALRLKTLTAISETAGFDASVLPPDSENPSELIVRVTPTTTKPAGPLTATVRLEPLGPNGEPLPSRRVIVRGRVASDLVVDPPQVSAGGHAVGDRVEETLTVSSRTGRKFTIEKVNAHGEGLSVERSATGVVRVKQTVTRAGEMNGSVEIVVRPAGDEPVTVTVPVIGYGTGR